MTAQIPEDMVRYLAARDREHAREIAEALDTLTPREQRLIKEAAVMGYVRGSLATGARVQIPPDSVVLSDVVGACIANSDRFPLIGGGEA
ncbi:hypothetical protein ACGFNU_21485 [Spirillospora sp. NPDC048911]|uniref:hypothetical protein n=1 Tax=Spirillospora sp. NPDC048911 TaxID=3364527 RepID=UPI0037214956